MSPADRRAGMSRGFVATLMLLACHGTELPQPASRTVRTPETPEQSAPTDQPSAAPSGVVGAEPATVTHETLAREVPESILADAVERSNAAAFAIWRAFEPARNFVASPHSIRSALALVYLASTEGEGRTSFRTKLMYPERNEDMDIRLLDSTVRTSAEAPFESANAIWIASQLALSPTYTDAVSRILPAEIHATDFVANPALAQKNINAWVSEHTRGKLQNVLQGSAITETTRAVLVNAVAFSGKWIVPFTRELTSPKPFRTAQGATIQAQMMVGSECRATFERNYRAAFADYRDTSVVFVAVVPTRWQEFRWNAAAFKRVWAAFGRAQHAELELPRMGLRSRTTLGDMFSRLGLDVGDSKLLRGMLATDEEIGIDLAIHEAMFRVDETSTEAAAATAITAQPISAKAPPPIFRVDRPFYFLLVERSTGLILFTGQVTNPTAAD